MFLRTVVAAVVVLIGGLTALAGDSPIGLSVGHNNTGVFVSAVGVGSVSSVMDFKRGDRVTGYTFNNANRAVQKPSDLKELLDGTTGSYKVVVVGADNRERTIAGAIDTKVDAKGTKTYFFVRAKTP